MYNQTFAEQFFEVTISDNLLYFFICFTERNYWYKESFGRKLIVDECWSGDELSVKKLINNKNT